MYSVSLYNYYDIIFYIFYIMFYQEFHKGNNNKNNLIDQFNQFSRNKYAHIFMLIYMEGCEPCNLTRPEWVKMENILSKSKCKKKNIAVISIDKDLFGKLKYIKNEPMSFPTIRYITNAGKTQENFEDAEISSKDRTINSFVEWIKLKTGENNITNHEVSKKKTNTKKRKNSKKQTLKRKRNNKRKITRKMSKIK